MIDLHLTEALCCLEKLMMKGRGRFPGSRRAAAARLRSVRCPPASIPFHSHSDSHSHFVPIHRVANYTRWFSEVTRNQIWLALRFLFLSYSFAYSFIFAFPRCGLSSPHRTKHWSILYCTVYCFVFCSAAAYLDSELLPAHIAVRRIEKYTIRTWALRRGFLDFSRFHNLTARSDFANSSRTSAQPIETQKLMQQSRFESALECLQ